MAVIVYFMQVTAVDDTYSFDEIKQAVEAYGWERSASDCVAALGDRGYCILSYPEYLLHIDTFLFSTDRDAWQARRVWRRACGVQWWGLTHWRSVRTGEALPQFE